MNEYGHHEEEQEIMMHDMIAQEQEEEAVMEHMVQEEQQEEALDEIEDMMEEQEEEEEQGEQVEEVLEHLAMQEEAEAEEEMEEMAEEQETDWASKFGYSSEDVPEVDHSDAEPIQGFGLNPSRNASSGFGDTYSGKKLGMPGELSAKIKDSFGMDTSKLSILESPDVAKMGAKATAQGNVIRFAPGQFKPDTKDGLKMLGHELNHVKDQAKGNVKANVAGTNIHIDSAHESKSDRAGEAFASGALSSASPVSVGGGNAAAPVQGMGLKKGIKKGAGAAKKRKTKGVAKGGKQRRGGIGGALARGAKAVGGVAKAAVGAARGVAGAVGGVAKAAAGAKVGAARGVAGAGKAAIGTKTGARSIGGEAKPSDEKSLGERIQKGIKNAKDAVDANATVTKFAETATGLTPGGDKAASRAINKATKPSEQKAQSIKEAGGLRKITREKFQNTKKKIQTDGLRESAKNGLGKVRDGARNKVKNVRDGAKDKLGNAGKKLSNTRKKLGEKGGLRKIARGKMHKTKNKLKGKAGSASGKLGLLSTGLAAANVISAGINDGAGAAVEATGKAVGNKKGAGKGGKIGLKAGAKTGAKIGMLLGPKGAAVGGLLGAAIGGIAGSSIGGKIGKKVGGVVGGAARGAMNFVGGLFGRGRKNKKNNK